MRKIISFGIAMLALFASSINTYAATTVFYNKVPENCDILFVGDSRTVGMMQAVSDSETGYICEVGKGLKWLDTKAEDYLLSETHKGMTVVFNLGVNDLYNSEKYILKYNDLIEDLKTLGCNVYFETVNPVGNKCKTVTNSQIDDFNKKMSDNLTCTVIDTNSVLKDTGFSSSDGLHYSKDTYKNIYSIVEETISEKIIKER